MPLELDEAGRPDALRQIEAALRRIERRRTQFAVPEGEMVEAVKGVLKRQEETMSDDVSPEATMAAVRKLQEQRVAFIKKEICKALYHTEHPLEEMKIWEFAKMVEVAIRAFDAFEAGRD